MRYLIRISISVCFILCHSCKKDDDYLYTPFVITDINEAYPDSIYYTDVCIIGGGASGIGAGYGFIDSSYKVLIIEKEDRLGGTMVNSNVNIWGASLEIGRTSCRERV